MTASACEVCGGAGMLAHERDAVLWRCGDCGHLMRDLALCPPRRDAAWGGTGIGERVRTQRTFRRVRALTRSRPVRRVLDVGCGDGALLRLFHDRGAEVVGCDPGLLGRPLDPVLNEAGVLHACTLDDLGEVGRFDLVLAIHVVEHLPTAVPAWQGLLDRVDSGGHLYAITPAADSRQLAAFGSAWWMLDDPTHLRFYSERSLAAAAFAGGAAAAVVGRPRDDSLLCDGLSAASMLRDRGVPGPVASGLGLAAAAPLVARRVADRHWTPVIDVLASAPTRRGR